MSESHRLGGRGSIRDHLNTQGIQRLFQDSRIDALICRSGMNVSYLSAMQSPGTLGRHLDLTDTPRESFVVWQATGESVLIVSEIASEVARATARTDHIATYVDYLESPETFLAEELKRLGLNRSRLGFDRAWFGVSRWAVLQDLLPEMEAVDCTDDLDRVRAIKSVAEVAGLREAADLLDRALLDVYHTFRPGQTERDAHARVVARAIALGADSLHGILQSSANEVLYGGESDLRLDDGCLLRTDYVLYLDGYAANLSRPIHVGRPTAAAVAKHRAYLDIYLKAVKLLRPGAVGGEVHRLIQDMFESAGWQRGPRISGHGLGRWFHQQYPLIVEGSADVLEAGMVVALEPISGYWHLQDEYLIRESSPDLLSPTFASDELAWTA